MSEKPRLLDLFCGAGGCTKGYQEAGFYVVGVDINPQPNYCGDEFVQDDAMEILGSVAAGFRNWTPEDPDRHLRRLQDFEAIHASPPCQAYSPLNAYNRKTYPDLVSLTRSLLMQAGVDYIIENVPQAPLIDPVTLCGSMFGLKLYRHRGFETNFPVLPPAHPRHNALCARNGYLPTPERPFMSIHGGKHSKAWQRKAAEVMGVPWMTEIVETCEAIPPAYTRWIGERLLVETAAHSTSEER